MLQRLGIRCTLVLTLAASLVSMSQARTQQTPPPASSTPPPAVTRFTNPLDADAIGKAAADLPRLHSLLVNWRGALILERYFNGARATRLANIKSASKSIVSALVGIAIDRKLIADVRQPIAPFFDDLLDGDGNAAKRLITIENLLTMQSGLATTSNRNYGAWVQSANWVRHALARPLESRPGTEMEYSTGNTHLLSAIITKASGYEHLAVRAGQARPPARIFARAVAARSAGCVLRRQRHAPDATADDRVRRAVPPPRTGERRADRAGGVG